jgi:AraC family transcriptional regulator
MLWNELYDAGNEPLDNQINDYVNTPLYNDLDSHIKKTYNVQPKLSYSNCSMDKGSWKGWNVKFQKSGKSLCTIYPKQGYFMALIPVSAKDFDEANLIVTKCSKYMQDLYNNSKSGKTGKSLAVEVKNKNILRDVKSFVALRSDLR